MSSAPPTSLLSERPSEDVRPAAGQVPAGWWSSWRDRLGAWRARGLRPRIAALRRHEPELVELNRTVERKFMAVGRALQAQAELSAQLVEQGNRLLAAAGTAEEGAKPAATEAADLVHQLLSFTEANNQQIGALLESMEAYRERISRLLAEEGRVERIVAPLRIIQTLFRIEASIMPVEVQTAFVALSGEIPKFEEKVRVAFAQHTEVLTAARQQITQAATRLREDAAGQAAAITATRQSATESLAGLERDLAISRQRETRLGEILRAIDQRAGEMIVGLQYQDITRQKLEHVLGVVREVTAHAKAPNLTHLCHACRLEALQAEAIDDDLGRAFTGLQTGVDAIRALLGQVENECWPRAEFATAATAARQRTLLLRDALQKAGALMPRAAAGVDQAAALLNSLGDVAASVASTASDMAEDMRMIALNAQVQAAQAGEAGAGLLILAERTYLISEEIKLVTRSIGTEFAEAARQLEAAVSQGSRLQRSEHTQQTEIEQAMRRVEQRLVRYEEETTGALGQLAENLTKLETAATTVGPEVNDAAAVCAPLGRLHEELAALATELAPFDTAAVDPAGLGAVFATAKRRYTMDSERAVHETALAATAAGPLAAPAADEPEPAGTPLKAGDVELF